jgi:Mg2+/Co2+ transporter CorC
MPVEDIVKNHDLLAKVMSHYRHHLEQLHNDKELQSLMSNAMKANLTFTHTIKQIEQILTIQGAKSKEEAKKHAALLTLAISQYAKDLEAVLEKAKSLLPDIREGDLTRLETEIRTVKAYLTKRSTVEAERSSNLEGTG